MRTINCFFLPICHAFRFVHINFQMAIKERPTHHTLSIYAFFGVCKQGCWRAKFRKIPKSLLENIRNQSKFSITPGCIRKIPPGPDLDLILCESGWSNITASLVYDIWPPSRSRAGLNPPLQKGEGFGVPVLIEMLSHPPHTFHICLFWGLQTGLLKG